MDVDEAMATTLIHNGQLDDSAIASRLVAPATRQSSDSPRMRPSAVVRSTWARTSWTAAIVASTSGRCSSWAMATSTSAW